MKYQVTIKTLNYQMFQYEVDSNSTSDQLATSIFNQTPNVRGVTVTPQELSQT